MPQETNETKRIRESYQSALEQLADTVKCSEEKDVNKVEVLNETLGNLCAQLPTTYRSSRDLTRLRPTVSQYLDDCVNFETRAIERNKKYGSVLRKTGPTLGFFGGLATAIAVGKSMIAFVKVYKQELFPFQI